MGKEKTKKEPKPKKVVRDIVIKKQYEVDEIAAALRRCGGFLSHTAEDLKMPIADLKHYLRKYKRLREVHEEVRESTIELAESELVKNIRKSNLLAIMFYLKCQAQDRGWVDKPVIKEKDTNKPIYIHIVPPEGYIPPAQKKLPSAKIEEDYIDV